MTDQDITQELPDLTNKYRYRVRPIGSRRADYIGGPVSNPRYTMEYGAEVWDSWTGDVMTVHWAGSADTAALVAETQAAERNAPAVALEFVSKLALHIDHTINNEGNPGDLVEDLASILEWHIGMLRGIKTEPLAVERLYFQAPEFNR
jgi:hypothetical protein